jgi:hypothetical protein
MPQFPESSFIKRVGKDVGELILGAYEGEFNVTTSNMITDEVIANFNVLRLPMKYWIVCDLDSTLIVA